MLQGKRAIVTGATAGIGREIALTFAKSGAHVAIFGTNKERAEKVLLELESARISSDQKMSAHLLDVSKKSEVDQVMQQLIAAWGGIDILVNNAGITKDGLLMKMSESDFDSVIAVNLKSVYNTTQAVVRSMLKARAGKIINVTSVVGLMGNAGQTNYAASKAGMIGFAKSLAKEVGSRGIQVNCIAPGFIVTSMTDALSEEQKKALLAEIPMGRFGSPQEIANAALFLASPLSDYVTGQVLTVDGGMVM